MTTTPQTTPASPATARIRVAVIGGGRSTEHEVSLASAGAVAAALDEARFDVIRLTLLRDHGWLDGSGVALTLSGAVDALAGCDVAVPMLHGRDGEDGTIAALLDLADVPYVGSGVRAGALGMDKLATKLLAASLGIAVAPGVQLTRRSAVDHVWDHPVIVKPAEGGSSHGVGVAMTATEMPGALAAAFAVDDRVLVEDLLVGREIDVPVIRTADGRVRIGPAVEILADGVFDSETKYGGAARFQIPAPVTPSELAALHDAATRMAEALDCRGVVRVDFFLTEDGPVLNEVNTIPGFTAASQVPRSFATADLAFPDLLALLVDDALSAAASRSRSSS